MSISSCIVGRAQETFAREGMQELLNKWGLDPEYTPIVFVCLGYISGEYPQIKMRHEGWAIFVGDSAQCKGELALVKD